LARSASVREPSKPTTTSVAPIGGLTHQGKIDPQTEAQKAPRDAKRRTVQVEYVPPQSQTARGEPPVPVNSSRTTNSSESTPKAITKKPLPPNPLSQDVRQPTKSNSNLPNPLYQQTNMAPPPSRPHRDPPRAVSDSTSAFAQYPNNQIIRPNTGGSMSSRTSGGRLPSRGNSYSQPLAPTVAATNAQGRLAQPKGPRYNISAPIPQPEPSIEDETGRRPASQRIPSRPPAPIDTQKGHRRSSTLTNIFGKSGIFGGKKSEASTPTEPRRSEKRYPPTSMKNPIASPDPRVSSESKRSRSGSRRTSFGFSRKSSDVSRQQENRSRRFSLLPPSFSLKNFSKAPDETMSQKSQTQWDQWTNDQYPESYNSEIPHATSEPMMAPPRTRVLQKTQRNFSEAYAQDEGTRHAGTSGPARRVMDFFRRRGKARSGEE
jgi:protein-serine/threonine kinase